MSSLLELAAKRAVESAYREGWQTGYSAGREDGRWDGTCWCDPEKDWLESKTNRAANREGEKR